MIGALQGVVFFPVQGDTVVNAATVESFGVWAYPTFVILNAKGEQVHRNMGYGDAAAWSTWLEGIKGDPVTLEERKARHARKPSFGDALALGKDALYNKRCAEAKGRFEEAGRLDAQAALEAGVPIQIARAVFTGLETGEATLEDVGAITTQVIQSPDAKPAQILEVSERLLRVVDTLGPEKVTPLLEMAYPRLASLEDEKLKDRHQAFLMDYALYVEHDAEKALRMKRAGMPAGWDADAGQLNEFAWWCFERRINLEEAEQLARRGVDLTPTGSMRADLLDTLAQLVYLRGDAPAAAGLIRQALEVNPASAYLKEQLAKFTGSSTGVS